MHLSAVVMTRNGGRRLERLLRNLGAMADEIVVGVDEASDDESEGNAKRAGARTISIENPQGYIEPHIATLIAACSGDWVLRLDDDELISGNFRLDRLPTEAIRDFDLIGFPRAWIVGLRPLAYIGSGARRDQLVPQYRLIRRQASWTFIDRIHTPGIEMKDAFVADNAFIFHMNLLDFTNEQRRERYEFYQSVREAPWNRTYLIDPVEVVRTGQGLPLPDWMHFPSDLV